MSLKLIFSFINSEFISLHRLRSSSQLILVQLPHSASEGCLCRTGSSSLLQSVKSASILIYNLHLFDRPMNGGPDVGARRALQFNYADSEYYLQGLRSYDTQLHILGLTSLDKQFWLNTFLRIPQSVTS